MGGNGADIQRKQPGGLSLAALLALLQPGVVVPPTVPSGTRYLLSAYPVGSGRYTRTYLFLANGQYEIATNCIWNEGSQTWSKDAVGQPSGLNTFIGGYTNDLTRAPGAGTWSDSGWTQTFQQSDDFYSSNPLPALPFCYSATADGLNLNRGCVLFPWRFASPPTQITFTTFGSTNMDGDPFADIVQTRCLFFQVYPITIGFTEIYGTVRVAP